MDTDEHDDQSNPPNKVHDELYLSDDRKTSSTPTPPTGSAASGTSSVGPGTGPTPRRSSPSDGKGTRAAVAPIWDAVPGDAARVAPAVVAARMEEATPLPYAVRDAGEALARDRVPGWRSLCFAVEGTWT